MRRLICKSLIICVLVGAVGTMGCSSGPTADELVSPSDELVSPSVVSSSIHMEEIENVTEAVHITHFDIVIDNPNSYEGTIIYNELDFTGGGDSAGMVSPNFGNWRPPLISANGPTTLKFAVEFGSSEGESDFIAAFPKEDLPFEITGFIRIDFEGVKSFDVPVDGASASSAEGQSDLTEVGFKSLLTVQDVEQISQMQLHTQFYDYKAQLTDPAQVANMDSFYGLSFQTEDGMKAMTLTVIDFDSTSSADQHFQNVKSESQWESMQEPIGDESFEAELNSEGMGSIVIFLKGDKFVQLHTAMPVGESPIVDLSGLVQLANKVDGKL